MKSFWKFIARFAIRRLALRDGGFEVSRGVTYYPNEKTGAGAVGNAAIRIVGFEPFTAHVNKTGSCNSEVVP